MEQEVQRLDSVVITLPKWRKVYQIVGLIVWCVVGLGVVPIIGLREPDLLEIPWLVPLLVMCFILLIPLESWKTWCMFRRPVSYRVDGHKVVRYVGDSPDAEYEWAKLRRVVWSWPIALMAFEDGRVLRLVFAPQTYMWRRQVNLMLSCAPRPMRISLLRWVFPISLLRPPSITP